MLFVDVIFAAKLLFKDIGMVFAFNLGEDLPGLFVVIE